MATEAHQRLEDQYGELATKANIWEEMANQQTDPYAYQMYKTYANDLANKADQLSREGLNATSRKSLLDMKARYSKEITPIEQAYTIRQKQAEEQQKALLQDPTLMLSRRAANTSIDEYLKNPQMPYDTYSGKMIISQTANIAATLAKELKNISSGRLDDYTKTLIKNYGLSSQDIYEFNSNPNSPKSSKVLSAIRNSVLSSIPKSIRDQYEDEIDSFISQGLWNAIGQDQISTYEDYGNRLEAQEKSYLNRKILEQNLKDQQGGNTSIFGSRIVEGVEGETDPNIKRLEGLRPTAEGVSTISLDKKAEAYKKAQDKYDKYMEGRDKKAYEDYRRWEEEQKQGATDKGVKYALTTTRRPEPEGYSQSKRIKAELERAKKAYEEEVAFIDQMEKEYQHLGKNRQERLQVGLALNQILQKRQLSSYTFNAKQSQYNDVRDGIVNTLNAAPKELFKSGFGLLDSNGKALSYDKVQEIIEDSDNISLKVKDGKNAGLKVVYKGKEYEVNGIEEIDRFNNYLRTINNYLSDFSSNITGSITQITPEKLQEINELGVANVKFDDVKLENAGNGYIGTTLYEPESGEYIKLLMDQYGRLIASNSLSNTLQGGTLIDQYFTREANRGLNSLIKIFAAKYDQ